MGVKIREKVKGSGVWWAFVNHRGERFSTRIGSEKAAIKTKEDFEAKLKLGIPIQPERNTEPKVTLEAYYKKFERSYLKTACRESTATRYEECFRLYLLPKFGKLGLDDIPRDQIKEFVADLVEKNLARQTIRIITANLCTVFSHAIEDGIIKINPALKLGKFFKQAHVLHEKIEPLTAYEVPLLLAKSRERDAGKRKGNPEYCPLFLCAIHTGMRAGEIAGLQWGDIDWNGKYLMVRRSVKNGKINPTKTSKVRRIDMSDDLLEEIAAYRRRRLQEALQDGKNEISDWVFASGEGTPIDMHNIERRELEKCLAAAKLRKIRFHDLRHYLPFLTMSSNTCCNRSQAEDSKS